MRSTKPLAATLALALSAGGCVLQQPPPVDQVKAIRVLEDPDPRTLKNYGSVMVHYFAPPAQQSRAYALTVEALKEQALREYADTTLLYNVHVEQGDREDSYIGYGIAARRLGT